MACSGGRSRVQPLGGGPAVCDGTYTNKRHSTGVQRRGHTPTPILTIQRKESGRSAKASKTTTAPAPKQGQQVRGRRSGSRLPGCPGAAAGRDRHCCKVGNVVQRACSAANPAEAEHCAGHGVGMCRQAKHPPASQVPSALREVWNQVTHRGCRQGREEPPPSRVSRLSRLPDDIPGSPRQRVTAVDGHTAVGGCRGYALLALALSKPRPKRRGSRHRLCDNKRNVLRCRSRQARNEPSSCPTRLHAPRWRRRIPQACALHELEGLSSLSSSSLQNFFGGKAPWQTCNAVERAVTQPRWRRGNRHLTAYLSAAEPHPAPPLSRSARPAASCPG